MSTPEREPVTGPDRAVARTALLTAALKDAGSIARVEVKRVTLSPGFASGLHLHSCPLVGVVVDGSILFQIDGEPSRVLTAGDAFFAAAGTRVRRFDAQAGGASFVGCALLGRDEHHFVTMLGSGAIFADDPARMRRDVGDGASRVTHPRRPRDSGPGGARCARNSGGAGKDLRQESRCTRPLDGPKAFQTRLGS